MDETTLARWFAASFGLVAGAGMGAVLTALVAAMFGITLTSSRKKGGPHA